MSSNVQSKQLIHVEIRLKKGVRSAEQIVQEVRDFITTTTIPLALSTHTKIEAETVVKWPELVNVESFVLENDEQPIGNVENVNADSLVCHPYIPYHRSAEMEMFETGDGDLDTDTVSSFNHWILPSTAFIDLWEHLIFEPGLKNKLLNFALSALTFSQHHVNRNVITCNRLLLLHGPPGTGKTSLCKALAQKLSVRTQHRYKHTHLVEINSHSLFSKWFSESGKLVMRLFAKIHEIAADSNNLVCVLIDEVESIAYARDSMCGQEPKDAMRVVNALLTQLDNIKELANVLILATSNLANTIDLAFLDRADIKQFIGFPNDSAIRIIYESMLKELMRVNLVEMETLAGDDQHEGLLQQLTERSVGQSGRTLRKLPYLAYSINIANRSFGTEHKIVLSDFLDALLEALQHHKNDQYNMQFGSHSNKN